MAKQGNNTCPKQGNYARRQAMQTTPLSRPDLFYDEMLRQCRFPNDHCAKGAPVSP